jgi:hypothetical protein
MKTTKEMIEAVKYMAKKGVCECVWCVKCPFFFKNNKENELCFVVGYRKGDQRHKFDKTLQTSAKNWLKENGTKLYLDPSNPGALTRIPNEFGSVGELTTENGVKNDK